MATTDVVFKTGTLDHLTAAFELCRAEDWNVIIPDLEKTYNTCPAAFQISEHNGQLTGACMGSASNEQQGFIALLVVDKNYRRRGIGGELLTRCLHGMGGRNVSLYCAHSMATFYQKYGFKTGDNPCHVYYRAFVPTKTALQDYTKGIPSDVKLMPLKELPLQRVNDYDVGVHLIDRKPFLQDAIEKYPGFAAIDSNGKIHGYGILKETNNICSFTPILAETPSIARFITGHLLQMIPDGSALEIGVYKDNPDAVSLSKEFGLPDGIRPPGYLMFTKERFIIPVHKVYTYVPWK